MSDLGKIIVLEGMDGSGKSSAAKKLIEHLDEAILLREPGGSPLGEELRDLLKNKSMSARTELLLFCAARAELVQEKILPAYRAGKTIVLDRFEISTAVYQGIIRGLGPEECLKISRFASGKIPVDQGFLFDISPQTSLSRRARRASRDRMEKETDLYLEKIRTGYLDLAVQEKYCILDAEKTPAEIIKEMLWVLKEKG